ncbi:MAG: hypothetical protein ACPGF7_15400, partial [Pontibacterium sp.]
MSALLTQVLDEVRLEYLRRMQENGFSEPYLTAERLCHEKLFLETDTLAAVIDQDPTLLAARAGDLILNKQQQNNPSVGVIICSNILAAALEGLLDVAVDHGWLEKDEEGRILVDEEGFNENAQYPMAVDFSQSEIATKNLTLPGISELSKLFGSAEEAYLRALQQSSCEAYRKALQISSDYSVFAPQDIAPLILENPLLLGLRPDGLIDDDLFAGDPPAGLIISSHLTRMLLDELLDLGAREGVLSVDAQGHVI